jgi:hypothetical protein
MRVNAATPPAEKLPDEATLSLVSEREPRPAATLLLAMAAVFTVFPLTRGWGLLWCAGALALLTLAAFRVRSALGIAFGLFATLMVFATALPLGYSQVSLGLSLMISAAVAAAIPSLRGLHAWAKRGDLDRSVVALIAATIAASSTGLSSSGTSL